MRGVRDEVQRWASVTKLVTALAALVAAEEGVIDLDEPAGPEGSTVRHLLAHASGLPFEPGAPTGRPGRRRVYSNVGFEKLADHIAERAEMTFADYLAAGVLQPLGMRAELRGSPAADLYGSLDDLALLARELQRPTLVAPETLAEATTVQFPGLAGVLQDFGRFDPLGRRTGPARATRPARSGTSAAPARFSGSIPKPTWHSGSSRTWLSATGRRKRGRGCRTTC